MKIWIFRTIAICIPCLTIYAIFALFSDQIYSRLEPAIVEYVSLHLDPAERKEIRKTIAQKYRGSFKTVPEHKIGWIAGSNRNYSSNGARVQTNNAGMRHTRPYGVKNKDTYRIICLGDSFVFGNGAEQQDRFCDQLEQWFTENKVKIDNKKVEALAIGHGGWTMLQYTTYLTSRLSNYDPDLILVLTIGNDVSSPAGASSEGFPTNQFSDLHREMGSAFFSDFEPLKFNVNSDSVLKYNLSPESDKFWEEAVDAMERLYRIQTHRGKKILLGMCVHTTTRKLVDHFSLVYRDKLLKHGIDAPFLPISYMPSAKTKLPHDSHPNKYGHQLIRDQYLAALAKLNWIRVDPKKVPVLGKNYTLNLGAKPNPGDVEAAKKDVISSRLTNSIDFNHLTPNALFCFLGGILPFKENKNRLIFAPWASIRSGFLLKREPHHKQLSLNVILPKRAELYPLTLTLFLNGKKAQQYQYDSIDDSGKKTLQHTLSDTIENTEALEIIIEANHYFTEINDHRMRSFRILFAKLD